MLNRFSYERRLQLTAVRSDAWRQLSLKVGFKSRKQAVPQREERHPAPPQRLPTFQEGKPMIQFKQPAP